MYQIQICKNDGESNEWMPLYGGHETFESIIEATRRYFLIRHNHIVEDITMWRMRVKKI